MIVTLKWLFWMLLLVVFYTYIGYGMLVFLLVKIKGKRATQASEGYEFEPKVTLVVPAYNEEDFIFEKAKNSLAIDYPKDKLRILFITDGSTDKTYEVLDSIKGIEVIHENLRSGKSAAENRAMRYVETPVVIFCDANTYLNEDCIKKIVQHYRDPEVGAVSGEKRISGGSQHGISTAGEGMYWKYESFLKRMDSDLYTIVGAAGELISFRSELVEDLEEDTILDDFIQSLRICQKGYRVVYEPEAYAVETASENSREELKRKIRIAAGGWQAMHRLRSLLNPFKNFTLTFQYVSHRVLRWSLSAFALPIIFILNAMLVFSDASHVTYKLLFLGQSSFYLLSILGWYLESKNVKVKALYVPYYFAMMNYAVFAGFLRWVRGNQKATWEKSARVKVHTK